ncbi:alpha/beta fold hydrolase [Catellatospora citrea]|uniref:Hydrolase n=1 Tax=Catellatospora citrea TaxID=53366 RepID=A0A8J3KT17_9ACTN|nr:alpha/beta hydrolase [Catellatospora citrea]RKE10633.1 proline iminopeptidase [Catellatospora citrea]GIG02919.1 hydrolase [Catellatospora citrea]
MSSLSPGMHSVSVDGTRQVYHVAGNGPVLIAHSGGPGAGYDYLRSSRLEEHFTMVYLEPVGTGDSGPLPDGARYVDTYADFLAALVDHLGVPKVYLLGHSHGGFVAQRYALDHPDRVAGLALYSSSPTTGPEFAKAANDAAAAHPQRHPDVPEAQAMSPDSWGKAETHEEKTTALQRALPLYFADFWGRRAEFEPLRAGIRSWLTDFEDTEIDYRPELPSISARTVVFTGRHDFICGPVWAQMLHEGIPGSRLVIFENSGHFAQFEEPDAYIEAVTSLLRD